MNIVHLNVTELGNFYFCRHPDFLAGLAKVAEPIVLINILSGLCSVYASIRSISVSNRSSIRAHLQAGTLHNKHIRYIYQSDFLNYLPMHATRLKVGESVKLSENQLQLIKIMKPRT
uniref:Uncharacterized protein n=1 Tax=Microbotryum cf. violaceum BFL-2013 TaxID=1288119 RepID=M1GPH0_9BASI|nr:hypothetical protein H888_mgp03 [Microbotryum cf. violaceum BFL-2013]AGE14655.1 hypothetical protein [Microbotryum cf. violaceum BFL-2013]